jgi:hypothetical protein
MNQRLLGRARSGGRAAGMSADVSAVSAVRALGFGWVLCVVLAGAGPVGAQTPAPSAPLDSYAEAAATTIIAEQACPGVQVKAGQLTTLRLAARVNAAQEAILEAKLRTRATQVRQQLAADGRDAWCSQALAAFGPQGSVAKGILVPSIR